MLGFIVEWEELNGSERVETVFFDRLKDYELWIQDFAQIFLDNLGIDFCEACEMFESENEEILILAYQPILSRATLQ